MNTAILPAHLKSLLAKIESRNARVGVLGLGYVGIPLSIAASSAGFAVTGFDILEERIVGMNNGESPLRHIRSADIANMRASGFEATGDFSRTADCDALILCIPTPLDKSREPDLSFVTATMESVAPYLRPGQIVALESTTWPGTTAEIIAPYLKKAGLEIGEDVFLVYSPEREDPGNAGYSTKTIPKVCGGDTDACRRAGEELYRSFVDKVVAVSSTRAAEMTKLLENIQRSVNIGLMNEMKIVATKMGLDIFEIIDAAATKPFGFTKYMPGPGIGGHCIPIDPFYLTWKAREFGVHTRFIELAGEINASMPDYVVGRLVQALNEAGKALNGARVLILGLAYKPDIDDTRESPSVFVMERLRDWGAKISYCDPSVPFFPRMRQHHFDLESVSLTPSELQAHDAVLLLTNHSTFDYDMIAENSSILIDTRGVFRGKSAQALTA